MIAKFRLLGLLGIFFCMPAMAQTIDRFPTVAPNSIEDSACYFKTTQGFTISLNQICGASQPKDPKSQPLSPTNNIQLATPSPIPRNPEFRPNAGANPGNPFGTNPNSNQCTIVDIEGNRCNPNP